MTWIHEQEEEEEELEEEAIETGGTFRKFVPNYRLPLVVDCYKLAANSSTVST